MVAALERENARLRGECLALEKRAVAAERRAAEANETLLKGAQDDAHNDKQRDRGRRGSR